MYVACLRFRDVKLKMSCEYSDRIEWIWIYSGVCRRYTALCDWHNTTPGLRLGLFAIAATRLARAESRTLNRLASSIRLRGFFVFLLGSSSLLASLVLMLVSSIPRRYISSQTLG